MAKMVRTLDVRYMCCLGLWLYAPLTPTGSVAEHVAGGARGAEHVAFTLLSSTAWLLPK